MQKAPVIKGSGLKPLDEGNTGDEVVHVFGKNLEERVVTQEEEETHPISFESAQDKAKREDDIDCLKKRKFDAITGEEDEETVFQSEFKLFVWDLPSSNWIEKGRGQLKLNDSIDPDVKRSRLIMRVSGTLKIILNVAIKHSFFKIIANSKNSIRFTDSQTVWAASGSNSHQLKNLIEERLKIYAEEDSETRKKTKSDDRPPTEKTEANLQTNESLAKGQPVSESRPADNDKEEIRAVGQTAANPDSNNTEGEQTLNQSHDNESNDSKHDVEADRPRSPKSEDEDESNDDQKVDEKNSIEENERPTEASEKES